MSIPREMIDCIDEAFDKAQKYEEIKEVCESSSYYSDSLKIMKIKSIINDEEIKTHEFHSSINEDLGILGK